MEKFGNPMANWVLNTVIESIQKFYHEMNFDNTVSGWLRHSANVMLMNKCIRFEKSECSCVKKVAQEEQFVSHIVVSARHNPGDNMKPTAAPQQTLEKQAVIEYLSLTAIPVETEGRKYSHRDMIMKLNDATTDLND